MSNDAVDLPDNDADEALEELTLDEIESRSKAYQDELEAAAKALS